MPQHLRRMGRARWRDGGRRQPGFWPRWRRSGSALGCRGRRGTSPGSRAQVGADRLCRHGPNVRGDPVRAMAVEGQRTALSGSRVPWGCWSSGERWRLCEIHTDPATHPVPSTVPPTTSVSQCAPSTIREAATATVLGLLVDAAALTDRAGRDHTPNVRRSTRWRWSNRNRTAKATTGRATLRRGTITRWSRTTHPPSGVSDSRRSWRHRR